MSISEQYTACSICNSKIPPMTRTELLDGNLCQDCFKKLSPWFRPWFSDYTWANVEEIRQQLLLRDENQKTVSTFHPTRKFGSSMMVLVDDNAKTFAVTNSHNLKQDNPDIIPLSAVKKCSVEIDEKETDIGEKRTRYQYWFYIKIKLSDHPYLTKIIFALNQKPLEYEDAAQSFLGLGGFDPESRQEYREMNALAEKIERVLEGTDMGENDQAYTVKSGEFDQQDGVDRNGKFVPGQVVTCPWCGSRIVLTASFRCEHCGGNI